MTFPPLVKCGLLGECPGVGGAGGGVGGRSWGWGGRAGLEYSEGLIRIFSGSLSPYTRQPEHYSVHTVQLGLGQKCYF